MMGIINWFRKAKKPESRWIKVPGPRGRAYRIRGEGDEMEVQSLGPSGDGGWRLVKDSFTGIVGDWERNQFNRALAAEASRQAR